MPVSFSTEKVEKLHAKAERLSDQSQKSFRKLVKRFGGGDPEFAMAVQDWAEQQAEYERAARKAQLAEAGLLEE